MFHCGEFELVIKMISKGLKKEKRDLTLADLKFVFQDNEKVKVIYKLLKGDEKK
jgi:hypothetical protein